MGREWLRKNPLLHANLFSNNLFALHQWRKITEGVVKVWKIAWCFVHPAFSWLTCFVGLNNVEMLYHFHFYCSWMGLLHPMMLLMWVFSFTGCSWDTGFCTFSRDCFLYVSTFYRYGFCDVWAVNWFTMFYELRLLVGFVYAFVTSLVLI